MYDSKEYSIRQILDASKLSKTTFYRYLNKKECLRYGYEKNFNYFTCVNNFLSVDHLSEEDFKAYFSFSDYDLEVINQHRGKVNKLGFAIQLCLARYPGCSLSNWPIKSTRLTSYVSRQLHLDAIDLKFI